MILSWAIIKMKNPKKIIKKEWKNITFNIVFMVFSMLAVITFYKNILLTSAILLLITIIGLLRWRSKLSVAIFIVFGILFGIGEVFVSQAGPWKYMSFDVSNVPSYLFILWGNTAMFIHQMTREIRKFGIKEDRI